MSTIEFDAERAHKIIRRLRSRVVELKAERDLLLKDAERYRWLKSTDRYWVEIQHIPDGAVLFNGQGQMLDAAIDAARGEKL